MLGGGLLGSSGPLDDLGTERGSLARSLVPLAGLAALGVLLALLRWELESVHVGGDVFWYARDALQLAGMPEDAATRQAAELMVSHGRGDDPES